MFILSLFSTLQLSQAIQVDTVFLCDKVAVFGVTIKDTPCGQGTHSPQFNTNKAQVDHAFQNKHITSEMVSIPGGYATRHTTRNVTFGRVPITCVAAEK